MPRLLLSTVLLLNETIIFSFFCPPFWLLSHFLLWDHKGYGGCFLLPWRYLKAGGLCPFNPLYSKLNIKTRNKTTICGEGSGNPLQ